MFNFTYQLCDHFIFISFSYAFKFSYTELAIGLIYFSRRISLYTFEAGFGLSTRWNVKAQRLILLYLSQNNLKSSSFKIDYCWLESGYIIIELIVHMLNNNVCWIV